MLSFEQPISQSLDELKAEVVKYKKLTLNKNLNELRNGTNPILSKPKTALSKLL